MSVPSASETFNLGTRALFIGGTEDAEKVISNGAGGTVYYGNSTVSSTSYDGTLTAGQVVTRREPTWIVSSSESRVNVHTKSHEEDSHNVHGLSADLSIARLGPGLQVGVPDDYEAVTPTDIFLGGRVQPGQSDTGPGTAGMAARVGGIYVDTASMRVVAEGMVRVVEAADPAELRVDRAPGQNIYDWTGGEAVFRKYPVGHTTVVSATAAPSATELYLVRTKSFPAEFDPATADTTGELMVNGTSISYTGTVSIPAWLSGDHAIGATELRIAELSTLPYPSAGRVRMRGQTCQYTGKSQILAANADGAHLAGTSTIIAKNVTQGEWDAIDQTEGAITINRGGQGDKRFKYSAASYNSGTSKITFTLDTTNKLDRNVADNATIAMYKLTGVTTDFQLPTIRAQDIGDTEISLNPVHPYSGDLVDASLVATIPTGGGYLRVETVDNDPDGPGAIDYPTARLAYSAFDAATYTFTLSSPLTAPIEEGGWVWAEGCPGLLRARTSGQDLLMNKLTGVSGLTSGASISQVAEWSPRYGQPMNSNDTSGFLTFSQWRGTPGWSTQQSLIGFGGIEQGYGDYHPGAEINMTAITPGSNARRQMITVQPHGLGVLGAGVRGKDNMEHWLHAGDVYTRVKPPNIDLDCDCDPLDPTCDCTAGGGGGSTASGTITVASTLGFPSAGRFKVTVHNTVTGSSEEREFDYTSITEGDRDTASSFNGVTYDGTDGYIISNFWMDAGAEISLANTERHAAIGSATNVKSGTDRDSDQVVEIGMGDNELPGVMIGDDELVRNGANLTWADEILATRNYADALLQGTKWKDTVVAATTANITLSGAQTIDGVSVVAGNRVLVKNQSTGTQNGIYVAAAGAWSRSTDADTGTELDGATVAVAAAGTANGNTTWRQTATSITLGVTAITWTEAAGLTNAGSGLTRSGSTVNVGAGNGITVNADDVALASTAGGAGLTYSSGVLAVGAGTGITVNADDVAVDTSTIATVSALNTYKADVDGRYRQIKNVAIVGRAADITGAATYVVQGTGVLIPQTGVLSNNFFYLDPDDYSISGRTTKLRVAAACGVNDTAPAITFTIGLYPVGTPSGGVAVFNPNLGTVTSGTTIAFASPAANSKSAQTYTSDIDLPAEGWYSLGVATSGAMTANSAVTMPTRIEVRNV